MDTVTGLDNPIVLDMNDRAMKRQAMKRVQRVYRRLPSWMHRSAPVVRLDSPANQYLGQTSLTGGRMALSHDTTQDLAGMRGRPSQKAAQKVLIHEIGHTLGLNEGQAELTSRKVSKRLFGASPGGTPYQDKVAALKQRHGDNAARFAKKHPAWGGYVAHPTQRVGTIRGGKTS